MRVQCGVQLQNKWISDCYKVIREHFHRRHLIRICFLITHARESYTVTIVCVAAASYRHIRHFINAHWCHGSAMAMHLVATLEHCFSFLLMKCQTPARQESVHTPTWTIRFFFWGGGGVASVFGVRASRTCIYTRVLCVPQYRHIYHMHYWYNSR